MITKNGFLKKLLNRSIPGNKYLVYKGERMKIEKSCGAVVFTREKGILQYVIIRSPEGFCGFPKGHTEGIESEQETALR